MESYPTRYRDKLGEVTTRIDNDGRMLRLFLRGVEFRGRDFDGLEPNEKTEQSKFISFTLHQGALCSCVLDFSIPIEVGGTEIGEGFLDVHLELGDPNSKGVLDREYLQLTLRLDSHCFISSGWSGWFEGELLDIQKQLPEGIYMKSCINCAFSDYHPIGHGMFGGLACFRDNKEGYRSVRTKADIFRVWSTNTECVQETYLCPEFDKRQPGTGYRG